MAEDAELRWNRPIIEIIAEKTGGRQGLLFLAAQSARLMDPYVPARNLVLAQNVRITADEECGYIAYTSPYAHYQWEGELYVDPLTGKGAFTDGQGRFWSRPGVAKVPSGRPLEHGAFRHPLATSHWDEAMLTARREDLVRAYNNYLRGKT